MAGFLCAQTAVIKLTKAGPARLNALGRSTTSYTIGGTLGPFLGGKLGASGDYYVGARYATAGSLLAVALVFLLPSSLDKDGSTPEKEAIQKIRKQLRLPPLGYRKFHPYYPWYGSFCL